MPELILLDTDFPDVKAIYSESVNADSTLYYCGMFTEHGIEACQSKEVAKTLENSFPGTPILSYREDILPEVEKF